MGDVRGIDERRGTAARKLQLRVDVPGYGLPTEAVLEYSEWYVRRHHGWSLTRYAYEYRPLPGPGRRAYHQHEPVGPHQHCVDARRPSAPHHYHAYRVVLEQAHEEFAALAASGTPVRCGALRPLTGRKTALALPDDPFKETVRLARRQRKSRSRLHSDAMADYVARHDPDWITQKLNEVADSVDTSLDPFVRAATYEVLKRTR